MLRSNKWLNRFDNILNEHIGNVGLNNELLAEKINISERHLFRRVKALTGLSPQKYLRRYRLQLAKQYLERGTYRTVKETANAVGYVNTSYFISQFEKEFGVKPLKMLQESGWR